MRKLIWMIAAGAAAFFGYRRAQNAERGVRSEDAGGGEGRAPGPVNAPSSVEERILRRVTETPGILQTELYMLFPEENRRILQETLRTMDREGKLKRKRDGATFRLFPA